MLPVGHSVMREIACRGWGLRRGARLGCLVWRGGGLGLGRMGLLRLQLPKCGQLGLYGVRNRDCLELGGFTFLIAICCFVQFKCIQEKAILRMQVGASTVYNGCHKAKALFRVHIYSQPVIVNRPGILQGPNRPRRKKTLLSRLVKRCGETI